MPPKKEKDGKKDKKEKKVERPAWMSEELFVRTPDPLLSAFSFPIPDSSLLCETGVDSRRTDVLECRSLQEQAISWHQKLPRCANCLFRVSRVAPKCIQIALCHRLRLRSDFDHHRPKASMPLTSGELNVPAGQAPERSCCVSSAASGALPQALSQNYVDLSIVIKGGKLQAKGNEPPVKCTPVMVRPRPARAGLACRAGPSVAAPAFSDRSLTPRRRARDPHLMQAAQFLFQLAMTPRIRDVRRCPTLPVPLSPPARSACTLTLAPRPTSAHAQDMVAKQCVAPCVAALPAPDFPDNPSPFIGVIYALAKSARPPALPASTPPTRRNEALPQPPHRRPATLTDPPGPLSAGAGRRPAPDAASGEEDSPRPPRVRPLQQLRRGGARRRRAPQPRGERRGGEVPEADGGDPGRVCAAALGPRAVAAAGRAHGANAPNEITREAPPAPPIACTHILSTPAPPPPFSSPSARRTSRA